jgi:hypothetical protein
MLDQHQKPEKLARLTDARTRLQATVAQWKGRGERLSTYSIFRRPDLILFRRLIGGERTSDGFSV